MLTACFILTTMPIDRSFALQPPLISGNNIRATESEITNFQPGYIEVINQDVLKGIDLKIIVFDWDDTLFIGLPWKEFETPMIADILSGGRPTEDHIEAARNIIAETAGYTTVQRMEYAIDKAEEEYGIEQKQGKKEEVAKGYEKEIKNAQDELMKREGAGWKEDPPIVGNAVDLLNALNEAGINFVVASGRDQRQLRKSASVMGFITDYFNEEEMMGAPTKKVDILKKIMKNKNLSRHQVVMIGDGVGDIKAAKEAGCIAIGLAEDADSRARLIEAGADIIVNTDWRNWDELFNLLNLNIHERDMANDSPAALGPQLIFTEAQSASERMP